MRIEVEPSSAAHRTLRFHKRGLLFIQIDVPGEQAKTPPLKNSPISRADTGKKA